MELGIIGKKALICAASQGLGRAIAMAIAQEGVELFLCARDETSLQEAAHEIKKATRNEVHYQSCDLASASSREDLIAGVAAELGGIDILINNVGGPMTSNVTNTSQADWQQGFDLLFQSVVHLNSAFLPYMKEQKWGRIITVTSLSVLEPIPNLALSNAMRSAVVAMCKTLADEVAALNITVNCVAPGNIATNRLTQLLQERARRSNLKEEEFMAEYQKTIPAQRFGLPEEFAAVVLFLASQQASYITGSTICVDGGKRRSTY